RNAEEARREAELRFRRIFDSGIIGVTVADVAGAITEANETFLKMLGYDERDLAGAQLDWMMLTPPEWRPQTARVNDELRSQGSARPFEKEYLHKDGSRVPVLVGAAALDGSRILTVVTNLTERRRAEEANVALAEQLRQAQKMEAIGRLAGGVAHDFNNALSVILSYSEMLIADTKEGDPARADLEEIRLAGIRGADMTRQLLMFSRQQVVQPRVLDIDELLAGMDRMLRRLVGEDVEMTLLPGASGRVRVDPGSIEQVLMNLVVNARDAMPTGGTITVETSGAALDDAYVQSHPTAKAGAYVVLSVRDTGTGMGKATIAHIFEPFFTTKEKGKGTGLGLSTVFGIVQQSEGHIEVDSEPGQGTTFRIYLPCVKAAADDAPPPPNPGSLRGSETVLLVEDEDQVRDVAEGILRRHGYRVLVARNAGEALLHFEAHPDGVDLLLSDVVMPQMSGPVLAKRLVSVCPALKVLFMSGYTDDETLRHGLAESAFSYLQKPLTVDSLTRKVREVLDGGNARE
ncbi:MAG TPA: ATP-binding protein, partial [Polyangiaceae bacterium]|nr:ATP-binding protein [Polyangiaceae bacterium]